MALKKPNEDFYGFSTDIYIKINGILIKEQGVNLDSKIYSMELEINFYTNDTKKYNFSQITKKYSNLLLEECILENGYKLLKTEKEFEGYIDC